MRVRITLDEVLIGIGRPHGGISARRKAAGIETPLRVFRNIDLGERSWAYGGTLQTELGDRVVGQGGGRRGIVVVVAILAYANVGQESGAYRVVDREPVGVRAGLIED